MIKKKRSNVLEIFIYSLNDVVRVRTGESGYDAMQGASSE